MMPPTGLTLIVHVLVIIFKNLGDLLRVRLPKRSSGVKKNIISTAAAGLIMITISTYIVITVASFLYVAAVDQRATWRMAKHTVTYVQRSYIADSGREGKIGNTTSAIPNASIADSPKIDGRHLWIVEKIKAVIELLPEKIPSGPKDGAVYSVLTGATESVAVLWGPGYLTKHEKHDS